MENNSSRKIYVTTNNSIENIKYSKIKNIKRAISKQRKKSFNFNLDNYSKKNFKCKKLIYKYN